MLLSIVDISGSALSAQTVRLNTIASNLANVSSISSSDDETYRARQPVFSAIFDGVRSSGSISSGVKVKAIVESNAPLRQEFRPDHPFADDQGYVHLPNVNSMEQMADMISASRAYQNNIEVLNLSKELLLRTLSMGQ